MSDELREKMAHTLADLVAYGFGRRTFLYGEINAKRLRAIKLGSRTVVLEPDLQTWLASRPAYRPGGSLLTESHLSKRRAKRKRGRSVTQA